MGTGQEPALPNMNSKSTVYYWVLQQLPSGCESTARRVRVRVKRTFAPTFAPPYSSICPGAQIDLAQWVSDPRKKATAYSFYNQDPIAQPAAQPFADVTATRGKVNAGQNAIITTTAGATSYWVQSTVPNGCGGVASYTIQGGLLAQIAPINHMTVNAGDLVQVNFNTTQATNIFWFNTGNPSIGILGTLGSGNLSFTAQNNGNTPLVAHIRAIAYNGNCAGEIRDFSITVNPGVGSRQAGGNSLQIAANKVNAHDVRINWQIVYEPALERIEVEKQLNGGEWNSIGQSNELEGAYLDQSGMGNETTYRLKLVHPDGRLIWSQEAELNFEYSDNKQFTLYPNPSDGRFSLRVAGELQGRWRYKLSDGMGRTLMLGTLQKRESSFDISHLPSAYYFLVITSPEGKTYLKKIAKQ